MKGAVITVLQWTRWRLRLTAIWVSITAACLAAIFFQHGDSVTSATGTFATGIILSLVTGVSMLVVLLLGTDDTVATDLPLMIHANTTPRRTRWLPTLVGVVLLALLAEINGDIWDPVWLAHVNYHIQAGLLIAGVALLAFGMAGRLAEPLPQVTPSERSWTRKELVYLLLILLLALGMRVWRLSDAVHFFVDEVHFTNPITHFDDATDIELLLPFSSVAAFPYLYPYLQWNIVQVFGYNLVGLRMVSAIFGVMNVAALIFLARQLFDRRVGWLAGILLAVFPVHVHYSRLGLNNVADPVFGTLALAFIARGLRSDGWNTLRRDFAYAGAMLGLTQYWYEGGRLLFPPLVLIWGVMLLAIGYGLFMLRLLLAEDRVETVRLLQTAKRINWQPLVKAVLVLMIVTMLVSAPVYYTLFGQGESLVTRLETAGVGGDKRFIDIESLPELLNHFRDQLRRSLMLHLSIRENAHYYRGETAMLLPVLIPFFVFGVFWSLFRAPFRAGASLMLLWIGLAIVGNLLMQDSRITARYVVSFPAMMLLVALGLRWIAQTLTRRQRMQNSILIGIVLGLVIAQSWYYFERHLPLFNAQFRDKLGIDSHDALFRAAAYEEDTVVMLIGDVVIPERDAIDFMDYLNPRHGVVVMSPGQFDAQAAAQIRLDFPHAFFVDPDDITTIRRLQAFFPQMQGPFFSPYDVPIERQFILYYVPKDE